jgi:hypothetical protein
MRMTSHGMCRMRADQTMRNGFGLDEGVWHDRTIELLRRMNSKILCLIAHQRVAGNEEKASRKVCLGIEFTHKTMPNQARDVLRDDGQRDPLVRVQGGAKTGEMDGDRFHGVLLTSDAAKRW